MSRQDAVSELFVFIENDNEKQAKQICERVRAELLVLKRNKNLRGEVTDTIGKIEGLLENVNRGQINVARGKCPKVKAAFNGQQLSKYLQSNSKAPQDSSNVKHQQIQAHDLGETGETDVDGRMRQVNSEDAYSRVRQSKRAGLAMLQNNPDIADLSDINRPTKIAERFSEMYDNEWTELFEDIGKHMKGKLKEAEVIGLLLEIVQEAYAMCFEESQSQIREMEKVFGEILTGQKSIKAERATEERTLLIQYRKGIAGLALERLKKNFRGKLNDICKRRLTHELLNADSTLKYIEQAVELSWWMCVQDPPVFMCPTPEENIDPNLYKAYTKSGSEAEFFVWPALRLHKDGAVLLKGVVQFK